MEDLSDEDILHLDNEKVPSFIGSRRGFTHSSGFYGKAKKRWKKPYTLITKLNMWP